MEEWSGGNFESVRPSNGMPIGPLVRILTWSQEQAEKKQAELIGMSTVVETDQLVFSRPELQLVSLEEASAYEVETQGGAKGDSGVVGEVSFAMPLAGNS